MSHQRCLLLLDVHMWSRMSLPESCNKAGLWVLCNRSLQGSPVKTVLTRSWVNEICSSVSSVVHTLVLLSRFLSCSW
jgi:hypothetical protein